jgi:hypothetical protein
MMRLISQFNIRRDILESGAFPSAGQGHHTFIRPYTLFPVPDTLSATRSGHPCRSVVEDGGLTFTDQNE